MATYPPEIDDGDWLGILRTVRAYVSGRITSKKAALIIGPHWTADAVERLARSLDEGELSSFPSE